MGKKSGKTYGRGRNWTFTINNPETDWKTQLQRIFQGDDIQYCIAQKEIAPTTGTPHLQGYVQLNKNVRFSAMKKLEDKAHWEVARGNLEQNQVYCTKNDTAAADGDENVWEIGLPKSQGKRTDIDKAVRSVYQGADVDDVIEEIPHLIRYRRALVDHGNAAKRHIRRPDRLTVEVHWGDSRVGKTYGIIQKGDVFKPVMSATGHWWWDGYNGQKRILFDDFVGNMKWTTLMQMLDPSQEFRGDIKGQEPMQIIADEYYFTSNQNPELWYDWEKYPHMKKEAFLARLTNIIFYKRSGDWKAPEPTKKHLYVRSDYSTYESNPVHEAAAAVQTSLPSEPSGRPEDTLAVWQEYEANNGFLFRD